MENLNKAIERIYELPIGEIAQTAGEKESALEHKLIELAGEDRKLLEENLNLFADAFNTSHLEYYSIGFKMALEITGAKLTEDQIDSFIKNHQDQDSE